MILLLLACANHTPTPNVDTPMTPPSNVKAHGNLPIMTEEELAAENRARQACLDGCQDDTCKNACMERYPIQQVEVIPNPPTLR